LGSEWGFGLSESDVVADHIEDKSEFHSSGRAMLDREGEGISAAPEIEVRVAPRVEFGAAPECLPWSKISASLPGVMHDDDRKLETSLEVAEVGQDGGDFSGGVFIDAAMEADEGIEDEEPRLEGLDRLRQGTLVFRRIDVEGWRGDDLDVEGL